MGNYIRWDVKKQHELMIKKFKYKTYKFNRTIDCYDYVDSFNYMNLHDKIKLYKHGYSKITDQMCREIRFKRIDRNTALKIVRFYENKKSLFEKNFCEWLGIRDKSLDYLLDTFKNKKFWQQKDVDQWIFKGMSKQNKFIKNKKKNKLKYQSNSLLKKGSSYITFGKGMSEFNEIL